MINICGGAGTGKTKRLIDFAQDNGATIVCENPTRMYDKLHGYGVVGLVCISFYEYIDRVMLSAETDIYDNDKYVIDDIAKFLSFFSKNTVGFTSIEGES